MTVLVGDPTYYEVIATDGQRRILVGYTRRLRSRRELIRFLLRPLRAGGRRLTLVSNVTGVKDEQWRVEGKADQGVQAGVWQIVWTGRTQREAQHSEPPESIYS